MNAPHLPDSVRNLDSLPDSALIDIASVLALTGKSRATLYRWVSGGQFPKPRKIGNSRNLWSVGDIRRTLAA